MLGENISRIRKERGLTQEALAAKLNVVRQSVSKWENGTSVPDAETLCRIADALEVGVSELLGRSEEPSSSDKDMTAAILASINEQLMVRNRQTRRIWRTILTVILVLLGFNVIIMLLSVPFAAVRGHVTVTVAEAGGPSSVGVIGGADGPTSIFVTASAGRNAASAFLFLLVLLVAVCVGIYFVNRRKR